MRLIDLLNFGETELCNAGVSEAELDARILLEYCTKKSRTEIFLNRECEISPEIIDSYSILLERRKKREPLAYIIGEQEFWSLPFYVSPDVLIPRPETEFLLDRVFALTDPDNYQKGNILDLCCGSGVITTVLGKETGKMVVASDISYKALEMCRKNAHRHNIDPPFLVQGHLLSPFAAHCQFSLIVSNPPYVSSFDLANNLMPEVEAYEPHQGDMVRTLFQEDAADRPAFQQVDILVDYAGRDRVVHARLEK
jgi:release factor glutamine methyltransferase